MDEQRAQAYFSLIQELLACPSEANDILNRHLKLVDEGFVQMCEQVAARFQKAGQENEAEFLQNVAQEVAIFLNFSGRERSAIQPKPIEQDYLKFLMELLKLKINSQGNPNIVTQFLTQHQDKLDLTFAQILTRWFDSELDPNNSEKNHFLAALLNSIAINIEQFQLDSRKNNIEIAIAAYQSVLKVYPRKLYPEQWATGQYNLGNTYLARIQGEKANNLEMAITAYQAALAETNRNAYPEYWAETQINIGIAYSERIKGDKAENLEKAIAAYQSSLEFYTRKAYPEKWAKVQANLGRAYENRIRGERSQNLEMAIDACNAALEVYTRNAYQEYWAETQINIGIAYSEQIKGDKAENLEKAIAAYQSSLEFYTRKAYPEKWAQVQANLGKAYENRIRGERSQNLEMAIAACNAALEIYSRIAFPEQWANTHNNLGTAYLYRIWGEKAQNLEMAIACYEAALEIYTSRDYPEHWAMTQNNLGTAYLYRIRGERSKNLEMAIAAYQAALKVRTRAAYLEKWAMTQNNLGIAYRNRILGEKLENVKRAIACFESALEVRNSNDDPVGWAETQNNLGNVYLWEIKEKEGQNVEIAITCYQKALQVRTRERYPKDWAQTQNNLGNAYKNRILGQISDNLKQAIAAYQSALEVYTRSAFPENQAESLFNLGLAYQAQSQHYNNDTVKKQTALQNAYNAFEQALDTAEYLRGEITSGEEAKRKLNEKWNQVYVGMVEVCLELGRYTHAIEYADRSKARNLTELIATRDAYPGGEIPAEVRQRLQELRQAISEEDRRLQQDPNPNYTYITQLREEFQAKYPYKPLKFSDIQSLLDDETVILEWYVLDDKFLTFTLTKQTLNLWTFSEEDLDKLIDWTNTYINDYRRLNSSQWRDSLPQRLETLAQILHLDEILQNLRQQFPNCQKLILIPHRFLHLFPLHALPVHLPSSPNPLLPDGEKGANFPSSPLSPLGRGARHREGFLQDLFPKGVGYAPNCQLLQQAKNRQRPHFNRLFAIQNPTQDLQFTDMEVEAIQSLFNPHQVLKHDQAEKAAIDAETLKNAHCTHFSCHGYFNFEDALKSALILAKSEFTPPPPTDDPSRYLPLKDNKLLDLQKCLTLEDILRLDLSNCRLVTLSACETGITDITSTSDEYIGLPSGFIFAGSPNVVSTLWAVADISTAIFMIQFYQTLQQSDLSVVLALRQTQTWLREATVQDLLDWVDSCAVISPERREQMKKRLTFGAWKNKLGAKRFESPYFWAAFCAIGA